MTGKNIKIKPNSRIPNQTTKKENLIKAVVARF